MTSEALLNHLKQNPFVLAPMASITDLHFREIMRELGCGVMITELVSAHGIEHANFQTKKLMRYSEKQRPVGIQIFGESPEILATGAKVVEAAGADFVDLNFGCPVPKVVKKGAGSAILKNPQQVEKVFKSVKAAVNIPVTVKIRTGWDEPSRNAEEICKIAYNEGLTWVAIHGRTRAAGYSGFADWDYISEVKSKSSIPIIGNGDIHTARQAIMRLKSAKCDAVMIGRGCLKNPWIFLEAKQLFFGQDFSIERDFMGLFDKIIAAYREEPKILTIQFKKLAAWYSSGYPGAAQFRSKLFALSELTATYDAVQAYFSNNQNFQPADTSQEAFLMGGHG